MIYYSPEEFSVDVPLLAELIKKNNDGEVPYEDIFAVPRGGVPVAAALGSLLDLPLVPMARGNTLIVDDLVDSGETRSKFPNHDFAALHVKESTPVEFVPEYHVNVLPKEWIHYFWEGDAEKGDSIREHVVRILEFLGEDPNREGLQETPDRVIRSWDTIYGGYQQDPAGIMKVFCDDEYDELVYLKNIEFYSMCEHHMLPFTGVAHVGYIPKNNRVCGVSKLARLVDCFSRRLQTQERIATQVANSLMEILDPEGCAVVIEGRHLCMSCRGVQKQHSTMGTSALRGVFRDNDTRGLAARNEFMSLIKG